mgnify:CR=1 FL=1
MTTPYSTLPGIRFLLGGAFALLLTGCASHLRPPAPLENRSPSSSSKPAEPERLPPGHENAGKPGYYTVRPGDRLIRISLEAGQNWRDLVRWNNLENPDRIEVGQVLRITQQELAYLVGLSRQRVNEALANLQARGLIDVEYGGLRVPDVQALRTWCCQPHGANSSK